MAAKIKTAASSLTYKEKKKVRRKGVHAKTKLNQIINSSIAVEDNSEKKNILKIRKYILNVLNVGEKKIKNTIRN